MIGLLDVNGRYQLKTTVPDDLEGLVVTLRSYAPTPTIGTYRSNNSKITFQ